MTRKFSTKDYYQLEEEEVERLVRKSPTTRVPRVDKERGRIQMPDKDLDSEDKDLSMNYKDIGGSIANRVALRILTAFDFDEDMFEEEDEEGEDEEEDDEEVEDEEEDDEEVEDEDLTEKIPRKPTDLEIVNKAAELYSEDIFTLQNMLASGDLTDSEEEAVHYAISLKVHPLPPYWDKSKVFEDGLLTLKAKRYLRRHMENWDIKNFADTLNYFKEKLLNESLVTGMDERERYYEVIIETIQKALDVFEKENYTPLESLDGALQGLEDPDKEYGTKDKKDLLKKALGWREQIRRTSQDILERVLEEVIAETEDTETITVRYAWLRKLQTLIEGSLEMKKTSPAKISEGQSVVSSIQRGFKKASMRRFTELDYALILKGALEFMKNEPTIKHGLVEYDIDTARRIALDYSIYTLDKGKYDNRIDAPTYKSLLEIMGKIQ